MEPKVCASDLKEDNLSTQLHDDWVDTYLYVTKPWEKCMQPGIEATMPLGTRES